MLLQTFHQSIAHLNDSSNFESSFEFKYIPNTAQNCKDQRCLSQSDREALWKFVQEFEALQTCSSSAKSTPKKTPPRSRADSANVNTTAATTTYDNIISGNCTTRSLTQSPEIIRNYIGNLWSSQSDDIFLDHRNNISLNSSQRSHSPIFFTSNNMGCKPLTCWDYEDCSTRSEEAAELMDCNQNSSADSSFDMHPPLLPSFNVTPPKQNRNAAYELARFLRGSFHVKRAKITHLQRSVSVNDSFQCNDNGEELQATTTTGIPKNAKGKAKKQILEDATNRSNTRIFSNSTSSFRRVWEQSSLRSPRSDKYTSKHCGKQCSTSMIASENDVFLAATGKDATSTKRHQLLPMRNTHSEKMTPATKTPRVSAWAISFEHLLEDTAGLATFAAFLKMEFSAENIYFWTSCERYKNTENLLDRQIQAKHIYGQYLSSNSSEPVNLDSQTRNLSEEALQQADKDLLVKAQKQIFHLMKFDSYQRFIRSELYKNCLNAEEKNLTLPYGDDNLDDMLKTNFSQCASPKLKKSASNAEDRRRKILLPWHRKTRSKSRDRMDVACDESHETSNGSSPALNTLVVPSTKMTSAKSTESCDTQRSSLPSSLKSINSTCSLCRVKFSDDATTIVQIKPNETVGQLVERLLEKRGLRYRLYEVLLKSHNKSIDPQTSSQTIAGEEVEIEQRVTFKLYLPDPKAISVKSKPKKYLHEVVMPILQKYNYDMDSVDVLRGDTMETLDLAKLVTTVDDQRLYVVLRPTTLMHSASNKKLKNGAADYQNDSISLHYIKSKELASEFIARNSKSNIKSSSVGSSSEGNLIEATNIIFENIIKEKTQPGKQSQSIDQYSLKSDEFGSEISVYYDTLNNSKGSSTNLRPRIKTAIKPHSSEGNIAAGDFNKPIIAKLKAGVKLQVTERVAEKQDELLISLKSRLDNPPSSVMNANELLDNARNKDNQNDTALVLRHIRSTLSPINKTYSPTSLNHESVPSPTLDKPSSLTNRTSLIRNSLLSNSEETSNHSETDETSAACKGPPPLPPKPKVLPTKPSNWGATNSD